LVSVKIDLLENEVLETFSASVSEYMSWWISIGMSAAAQNARAEQLVFDYSSLRERAVIKRWEELREEYINYPNKVRPQNLSHLQTNQFIRLPTFKAGIDHMSGYRSSQREMKQNGGRMRKDERRRGGRNRPSRRR
jgi:hypothetical protein